MDTLTRRRVATRLLTAGAGIVLLYTTSRMVPILLRKLMRGMMRSMMHEMMRGEGACACPPVPQGLREKAFSDNLREA